MIRKIRLDLYPNIRVFFIIAKTEEEAFKEISKKERAWIIPSSIDYGPDDYGFVIGFNASIYCVLLERKDEILVHELVHVTWRIAKSLSMEYTYENQELQAYLLEFLYKQCIQYKKKEE